MISVRVALFITAFLGALWAVVGVFTSPQEVGVGMAVAAASIVGWGLCDWLEDR